MSDKGYVCLMLVVVVVVVVMAVETVEVMIMMTAVRNAAPRSRVYVRECAL